MEFSCGKCQIEDQHSHLHGSSPSESTALRAEILKYLQNDCGAACSHIHMLPVYHLSLLAHNSHHGSFGRGISERHIDCRHFCANVIDTWNQVRCSQDLSHHSWWIYCLSLLERDFQHGSFRLGVTERHIDCMHFCTYTIDTWSHGSSEVTQVLITSRKAQSMYSTDSLQKYDSYGMGYHNCSCDLP